MFSSLKRIRFLTFRRRSPTRFTSHLTTNEKLDQINEKLAKLKQQIMHNKQKHKPSSICSLSKIQPFSLRVLSTGYLNDTKSCLLMSDDRYYLVNCGESISRVLNSSKIGLKRIEHLFLTRTSWNCVGGLNSLTIELGQDSKHLKVHSPLKFDLSHKLSRCVFEKDCKITQHDYSKSDFEDESVRVKQIYANSYLFELKRTAPKVLKEKMIEMNLESGPWIKEFTLNGLDYTTPDGRLVKASDLLDYASTGEKYILFIDCLNEEAFDKISKNELIKNMKSVLIVHLSDLSLIKSSRYTEWMKGLNECKHLVLDDTRPTIDLERIYELQAQLNLVNKLMFPLLPDQKTSNQNETEEDKDYIFLAQSNMVINIRPEFKIESDKLIKIDNKKYLNDLFEYYESNIKLAIEGIEPKVQEILNQLKAKIESNHLENQDDLEYEFPRVILLGSSSAQASAYRNVSGIFLKLSPHASILLDCGEGTKNQLARFFSSAQLDEELTRIKCVFITHNHTDHHNGLYGLVLKRAQAFQTLNLEYEPLVLMFPRNLTIHLNCIEHICKENFFDLVRLVPDELFLNDYVPRHINLTAKDKLMKLNQPYLAEDFTPQERKEIVDEVKNLLNLNELLTIRVNHIPFSYALCLTTREKSFKLIYSGDCRPSNYLSEIGKNCDLLIHECTFDDTRMDRAVSEKHSTLGEVLDVIEKMNAQSTILTHFSPRYGVYPCTNKPFKPGVIFGFDFMVVDTHNVKYLHDETTSDVLKVLFREQIEVNLIRSDKKIFKRKLDEQEGQI